MRWIFAPLLMLCSLMSVAASAETRVALVIGNGAYRDPGLVLANPKNDARAVAAALGRSGFETILGLDLDRAGMEEAAISFARAARTADVALIYYSGHAMQFGGVNYLTPIDFTRLTDEADLRRMIRVDEIVADLQQAKNLRILVLDSCRDNPLAETLKRSLGATRAAAVPRGLAKIDAQGMIVSYATQSGQTADDGEGPNSPYTAAFLRHIEQPEEIGTVFRDISEDVYDTTRRTRRGGVAQLPELSLSLVGKYYLRGKPSTQKTDPCAAAAEHWRSTEAIGSIAAFEDHLARFSSCSFAGLAQARVAALRNRMAAAQAAPVPAAAPASAMTVRPSATIATATAPERMVDPRTAFDGSWRVTSNVVQFGRCRPAGALSFSIVNGRMRGSHLSGQVDAQGRARGIYLGGGATSSLAGQFSLDKAAGTWSANVGCGGRWTAQRG